MRNSIVSSMGSPASIRALAVIPAHNEAQTLGMLVARARSYLPVLVIDDGSSDDTARIARQAGATVIEHAVNKGKGASLQTGFAYALKHSYDLVLTLDADGQHDPDEIPLFLKAFNEERADLIIGQRDFSKMPPVRRLSNWLGTHLLSRAIGMHLPDNQSGYRLISRRLLEISCDSDENHFEFEVEMIIHCVIRNFTMRWIPIRTIYQGEKSHIRPLQHLIHFIRISCRAKQMVDRAHDRQPLF